MTITTTNLPAKAYEIFGAGYGKLYVTPPGGQKAELGLIRSLRNQGLPPLGSSVPIRTIDDYFAENIIPPQAVGTGKMSGEFYALLKQGFFASLFNGAFPTATSLVDVLRGELQQGAMKLEYHFLNGANNAEKILLFEGVVITNALQAFNIQADNGAAVASYSVDMEYTRTLEMTSN